MADWISSRETCQAGTYPATMEAMNRISEFVYEIPAGYRPYMRVPARLYASPEGHFYALSVQAVVASVPKPYEEVREDAAKRLHAEKIQKGAESYAARLRGLGKVEVFLHQAQ